MPGRALVGREAELAEVRAFLDAAGVAFATLELQGETGIGKTTLWRVACELAEQRGWRVLVARPTAAEAKFSFAGVGDLLGSIETTMLETLPPPQRSALEVALLRASPGAARADARAVSVGFLTLIRNLAAPRPVLLAIDDAQWLDRSSRAVIEAAARRLGPERVGLVYSMRLPLGRSLLAPSEERCRRLTVGALSLAALATIISDRLNLSLPRPALVRIREACQGNPFYALEIARLLADTDVRQPVWDLPVPHDLQGVVSARIRRLPAATRQALRLAAVISRPEVPTIEAAALAPAEEAGIISTGLHGEIRFAHPLFAAAVLGSMSAVERRELHRRAAELVDDPEARARHLALASVGVDPEVCSQLDRAADAAARRGAPAAAAELLELACERTARGDGARQSRLLSAAHHRLDAGDAARAQELADRARSEAGSDVERARSLRLQAQLAGRQRDFRRAQELAEAGLELAGQDAGLGARLRLELTFCATSLGDLRAGEQWAQAALDLAGQAGDDAALGEALAVLSMSRFLRGGGLDQQLLARAVALEDPAQTTHIVMRPRVIQGFLELFTGDIDAAAGTLGDLRLEALARGHEGELPLMALYLVWTAVWRGRLDQAEQFAREGEHTAALVSDPAARALAATAGALADAWTGRLDEARQRAVHALEALQKLNWLSGLIWPLWALGLAGLSQGELGAVDVLLGPAAAQLEAMGAADPVLGVFLPDEIEALVGLGRLERARELLELFARPAADLERGWACAAAARCEGAILAAEGDWAGSEEALQRSLTAYADLGMPLERARTLLALGQAARRFKKRGQARRALTEALEEFERLGAKAWSERCRPELARLGRRAPSEDELTATERRVAELAAEGLTNQEVAARLYISVKTVEANLTRVYRKLGVHSRAALAHRFTITQA